MNEHGHCPNCGTDLDGGSIWQYFRNTFVTEGYWKDMEGNYLGGRKLILSPADAEKAADEVAEMYGATRESGNWGRAIGIYDMEKDRTVRWKCPDCDHEWNR